MDSVLIIVLRHDDDPLDTGGGSEVDKVFGGLDLLLARRDVDGGIERGDAQPLVAQRASSCLGVVALKRAALAGENGVDDGVVNLDAGKIHLERGAHELVPRVVGPTAGGKGKLH